MSLNLDPVRLFIEEQILDERVSVSVGGETLHATSELNPATGQLEQEPDAVVWEGDAAVIRTQRVSDLPLAVDQVGPSPVSAKYTLLAPIGAPGLEVQQVVTVLPPTKAQMPRDHMLPGERFRITEVPVSTFAVVRLLGCERLD